MVAWSSVLFAVTAAIAASASPLQRRAPPGIITNCQNQGQVALTFDDGPSENLSRLVDVLNGNGVKATFFFNGQNYGNIYDRQDFIHKAYNSGHQIASHTWSHAHLTQLNGDALNQEFSKVNDAIKTIIGKAPAFFRPPFGEYNDDVLQAAQNNGVRGVNWSFDSGDSTGASAEQSKGSYADVANNYPAPLLALNHETHPETVDDVIPYAIKVLKDAGYTQFVTVAQCVNMPPYH